MTGRSRGIIFGATAALYGKITLKYGRVEQTNFDTYQMLRMNDAPAIEVHLVRSAGRRAEWVRPGHRRPCPPSPTRSLLQPASAYEKWLSTSLL